MRKQIPKRGQIKPDKFKLELKHCFVNSIRTAKTTTEGAEIYISSNLHTKATYPPGSYSFKCDTEPQYRGSYGT